MTDSAGAPLAGATVHAEASYWSLKVSDKRDFGTVTTGADGAFVFERLPPGLLYVVAGAQGRMSASIGDPQRPDLGSSIFTSGEVRETRFVMYRPATLETRISCRGCDALHEFMYPLLERNVGTPQAPVWLGPVTGLTGPRPLEYTIDSLIAGEYRLRATNGGTGGAPTPHSVAVTVIEGETVRADITFAGLTNWQRDLTGRAATDLVVITGSGLLRAYSMAWGDWWASGTIGSGWKAMTDVLMIEDFSGDEHADLIARDAAGRLWLYPGNGAGGFLPRRQVGAGWQGFTAIFSPGDFNGDAKHDVMARDRLGVLWLYPGNGSGGFGRALKVGSGWNGFREVMGAGDFDRSGTYDVLARDAAGSVWVYPGNGRGGWGARKKVATLDTWWYDAIVTSGSADGDYVSDLFVRRSDGALYLFRGTPAGAFELVDLVGSGWSGLRFVD